MNGRAVYLRNLEKRSTPYVGDVQRIVVIHELTNVSLVRSTDPSVVLDQSSHMRYSRMPFECMTNAGVATPSAVVAVRKPSSISEPC